MAKTAPDTFVPVPDAVVFPQEPIHQGNAAGASWGLADLVRNLNHLERALAPMVVFQPEQFYNQIFSAGSRYLTTADQAAPTVETLRQVWRIPTIAGIAAAPTLQIRLWAETSGAGVNGFARIVTGAGNVVFNLVNNAGNWAKYSASVPYSTAAAFETVRLNLWRDPLDPAGEVAIKVISMWIDRGDNPCPAGLDVEPWVADEPLATYMPRLLTTKLEALVRGRRGVVLSYSEDNEQIGRTYYQSGLAYSPIQRVPVRYGPHTVALRIAVNGYGPAGSTVTTWTEHSKKAGIANLSLALPLVGAYDMRTSWVMGTIAVGAAYHVSGTKLWTQVNSGGGGPALLTNICAWEEPA